MVTRFELRSANTRKDPLSLQILGFAKPSLLIGLLFCTPYIGIARERTCRTASLISKATRHELDSTISNENIISLAIAAHACPLVIPWFRLRW
jgi:hypothetical protein